MGTVIAGAPYGSRSRSRIPAWIRVWIFRPRDRLNTVSLSDKSFPSIWEILFLYRKLLKSAKMVYNRLEIKKA